MYLIVKIKYFCLLQPLSSAIENLALEDDEDRYDQDGITPSRYMEERASNRSSNSESSDNSALRTDKVNQLILN